MPLSAGVKERKETISVMEGKNMLDKLMRLNLQYFADGDADQTADTSGGQEQTQQQDQTQEQQGTDSQQSEEKLFKQEDVNNITAKEKKKAEEKLLKQLGIDDFKSAKEGMEKFREWQESQKTEQEKQQEQLQTLSEQNETLSTEKQTLQAQISAMKQGVQGESVEDVVALAERLVNDDTTMDDAIKQVVEKYPHFVGKQQEQQEEAKPSFTTGMHSKQGGSDDPFQAKLSKYQ